MKQAKGISRTLLAVASAGLLTLVTQVAVAEETVDPEARSKAANAQQEATQAQQGVSNVAGGLVALQARVAALEAIITAPPPPISDLTVDCDAGDLIQTAVDQATPGTSLTITVNGTCTEDVVVTANDITILGVNLDGHVPVDGIVGTIHVRSADRVTINGLIINNDSSPNQTGVSANRGAAVILNNLIVSGYDQGGYGIVVSRNAHADINWVDVSNPATGEFALFIGDGGSARISNSSFSSENGAAINGSAIGLFRAGNARLDGGNTITNTATASNPGNLGAINNAIYVTEGSQFQIRQSGATDSVTGNVVVAEGSVGWIRNALISGISEVRGGSVLMLSHDSDVAGDVYVKDASQFKEYGPLTIAGSVYCDTSLDGVQVNSASVSGSISATCTELLP